jgi:hypothetical protein
MLLLRNARFSRVVINVSYAMLVCDLDGTNARGAASNYFMLYSMVLNSCALIRIINLKTLRER